MAQVVYTHIDKIEDIASAVWSEGVQDSYAETQRIADGGRGVEGVVNARHGQFEPVDAQLGLADAVALLARGGGGHVHGAGEGFTAADDDRVGREPDPEAGLRRVRGERIQEKPPS